MFTCRGCNKRFTPKRKKQQYHERACFLNATVKLIACPECGIKFQKKRTDQICCTPKCANVYRAKKLKKGILVLCAIPNCTKQKYVMPSRIKKKNFCGRKHQLAYLKSPEYRIIARTQRHTPERIEKIRQASLNRDYNISFTLETRRKLAEGARRKHWTKKAKEKLRVANLGKKLSEEHKKKIRANAKYAEDNLMYKGDDASYVAKHLWAKRHLTTPLICVEKYKSEIPCSGRLELSNKDHKYKRDIADWDWRCTGHHRIYDIQHGLVHPRGQQRRFFSNAGSKQLRGFTIDGIIIEKKEVTTNYL